MTYNEDDLRYEAARQHAILTEDPDFTGVGEMMQDEEVPSCLTGFDPDTGAAPIEPDGPTWDDICADGEEDEPGTEFNKAQRKVHDLINRAADCSRWAVDLGADSLEPEDHTAELKVEGEPLARMHFAFAPKLSAEDRHLLMIQFAKKLAEVEV